MTKTFERFLRTLDDDDLALFAAERHHKRPPYWRTLAMALRIEMSRRGLALETSGPGHKPRRPSAVTRDVSA